MEQIKITTVNGFWMTEVLIPLIHIERDLPAKLAIVINRELVSKAMFRKNHKLSFLTVVVCIAVGFFCSLIFGCPARNNPKIPAQSVEDPLEGLPISLNGKVASDWTDKREGADSFYDRHWHDGFRFLGIDHKTRLAFPVFDDDRLNRLCRAIQAKDILSMKNVLALGVDLNSVSREGWTPLYWAFHFDDDPRPFLCLLENGADPNVPVTPTRPTGGTPVPLYVYSGASVSHLVAMTRYNRLFEKVFANGGDPNVVWFDRNENRPHTPFGLLKVGAADIEERFSLMLSSGADVNRPGPDGKTPAMAFVFVGNDSFPIFEVGCRLVNELLDVGADFRATIKVERRFFDAQSYRGCYFRLIHWVALARNVHGPKTDRIKSYQELVAFLELRGESLVKAQDDLLRWQKWLETGQTHLINEEYIESKK